MSERRTYAERASRFSELSVAARSAEERESYLSIAQGYLRLARYAAGPLGPDVVTAPDAGTERGS